MIHFNLAAFNIPDAAWPSIAGIIGAAGGAIAALMTQQSRAHTTTLLLNQQSIKDQLSHTAKSQAEAARQQKAVTTWLSAELARTKEELEKVRESSQKLEDEVSALRVENAKLVAKLDIKDSS